MSRRDDGGYAAVWVVFVAAAMLAMAGLVIDGGYTMSTKREAERVAEQAARAAADQLDVSQLRSGRQQVEPQKAAQAARDYLAHTDMRGTAHVDGNDVVVKVTGRQESVILSAFGKSGWTVHGSARASGINETQSDG